MSVKEKCTTWSPGMRHQRNRRASFALSCSVRWLAKLIKQGGHGVGAGNGRSELAAAGQFSAIRRRLVNDRYRDLVTRANKTGLVLAGLLGLLDVVGLLSINTPFPEGMTTPPDWLVILVAILGLVTLAAIVPAWRGNHGAVLVVVVTRILSAISAVPAYFVNVPSYILITTTVLVVLTILAVWLILQKSPTCREKRERVTTTRRRRGGW